MSLDQLRQQTGKTWPAIARATVQADAQLRAVADLVKHGTGEGTIDSGDISVVVFGSLARREWTGQSDLDWTLLIDGEADPEHALTASKLAGLLKEGQFKEPGRTGVFGHLAFSHSIIHQIGGQDDTNRNTTQRMLLLLESRAIHRAEAYERVLRGILLRYLHNDYRGRPLKVPRFLLNDVHRFWRTMCVDYAGKYRDRAAEEWALRIIKLRMSRKLLFAAGLITCYSCHPQWQVERDAKPLPIDQMIQHLLTFVKRSPLEIIADALFRHAKPETSIALLDAYDSFLAALDDPEIRTHLMQLRPEQSEADGLYLQLQEHCNHFGTALEQLFLDDCERVARLTRVYGVF